MVRLTLDLAEKTDPEKQCAQEASQLPAGMTLSSYSWFAMISASSAWMNSDCVNVSIAIKTMRPGTYISRLTSKPDQRSSRRLDLAPLDKVSRTLRKEEQASSQNEPPKHLNSHWNAVRSRISTVLSPISDAGSQHDADSNAELVSRDDAATDFLWCNLAHVQDNDGRDETDAETSDETADDEEGDGGAGYLEDDADDEDATASDDGSSATDPALRCVSQE